MLSGDLDSNRRPAKLIDLLLELNNELFIKVDLRLRADVPVVSYLSGGVDSSLVARLAESLGLVVKLGSASVGSSEAAAREARYGFLAKVSAELGACAVATAHTPSSPSAFVVSMLTMRAWAYGLRRILPVSAP